MSDINKKEPDRRLEERRPGFLEVPGLLQKVCRRDKSTGAARGEVYDVMLSLRPEKGPLSG